jgi:hypothetical protein
VISMWLIHHVQQASGQSPGAPRAGLHLQPPKQQNRPAQPFPPRSAGVCTFAFLVEGCQAPCLVCLFLHHRPGLVPPIIVCDR